MAFNLTNGQLAERKTLITVAEWFDLTNGRTYAVTTEEPSDWATSYTSYYTKSGDTYSAVTGTAAPTWAADTYYGKANREILGIRTPDSSIEYNVDSETTTDIRGNNYTDINSTQPQQDFDPFYIRGGSTLAEKLDDMRRRNALTEFNQFTCYIITEYSRTGAGTQASPYVYPTERHTGCTISVNSIGGDTRVNMPISVYFSNKITLGSVDEVAPDFTFTPDTAESTNG